MKLDAILYVIVAITAYLAQALSSDNAYKHIDAVILFYLQSGNGALGAGALALKMFRSEVFAKHKANGNGHKPKEPNEKPSDTPVGAAA